jgi:hypothetical protein
MHGVLAQWIRFCQMVFLGSLKGAYGGRCWFLGLLVKLIQNETLTVGGCRSLDVLKMRLHAFDTRTLCRICPWGRALAPDYTNTNGPSETNWLPTCTLLLLVNRPLMILVSDAYPAL